MIIRRGHRGGIVRVPGVLLSALGALLALIVAVSPQYAESAGAGKAAGSKKGSLSAIRHRSSEGKTRVVLDLTSAVKYKKYHLTKPERLVIDLEGVNIGKGVKKSFSINDGILKSVRVARYNPGTVRVVLDISSSDRFSVLVLKGPPRLVVDVYSKKPVVRKPARRKPVRRTIVIDAGHGGHDPGAVGRRGLREKDVTLAIALRLRDILKKDPKNRVVLTRSTDKYITLKKRTSIAIQKEADLFISIHANASRNRKIRGVETYFLNWTDDEEALKVAARENKISVRKLKRDRSELNVILTSLALDYKKERSLNLAGHIQKSLVSRLRGRYKGVKDIGVRKGPFYVLYTNEIPSALIEVSFISNPTEEKRLRSRRYIDLIVKGISRGILSYVKSLPSEFTVAQR